MLQSLYLKILYILYILQLLWITSLPPILPYFLASVFRSHATILSPRETSACCSHCLATSVPCSQLHNNLWSRPRCGLIVFWASFCPSLSLLRPWPVSPALLLDYEYHSLGLLLPLLLVRHVLHIQLLGQGPVQVLIRSTRQFPLNEVLPLLANVVLLRLL